MLLNAPKPTIASQNNLQLLLLSSLPKTASRNTAQLRPNLAQRTQLALELFRIVNTSATITRHAGPTVLQRREVQLPALSGNAFSTTTVSTRLKQLLPLLLTLNNALRRNAPSNGPHVKRTPSVYLLSKNASPNAEPSNHAGNSVLLVKKTQLLQMLPNALLPMTASRKPELLSQLNLHKNALKSTARMKNRLVKTTEDVS